MSLFTRSAGLLAMLMLTGCAVGPAKYSSTLPVNLEINTTLDKRPDVFVALDIDHINRECELSFDGRIELKAGSVSAGLPTGDPLYMEVIFAKGSGSIREGAILVLRPGSKYNAEVSYVKGIYSAELFETRQGKRRKITMIPLQACKPA